MRTEPDLDRAVLAGLLADRYELDIAGLTFVPFGTDSWSYVATGRTGLRSFVKISRPASAGVRPGSELPLMAALADGLVPVPRPVADRDGDYTNAVDGFDVQVLEYLAGDSLEDEAAWPDELYARVAETVAALHASTGAVGHLVERRERFELPFVAFLAASLASLAGPGSPSDTDAVAAVRAALAPREPQIRAAIARLEALRDELPARHRVDVLCHTDIWGSNLLRSGDGTLHLLDWNGVLIGPPEHDLFMFAGTSFFPAQRFGWFLDHYEAALRTLRGQPV
ncbi:MAG: aminoglycoside phosphotransferase family protein, partial [Candidatus Limnocylindrales bacterium]